MAHSCIKHPAASPAEKNVPQLQPKPDQTVDKPLTPLPLGKINIMKNKLYRLLFAASVAVMAQAASAAVLFTDNFNVLPGGVSGSQDVNQQLGNGRQSGPLAAISSGFFSTYTFGADHHQTGNTTTDVGQPGGATNGNYVLLAFGGGSFQSDLDIANVSSGPLTIEVDMYNNGANPGGGADTQWVAFTLGVPGNTGPNSGGAGEFGFLKRASGGVQVFQNGSDIAGGSLDAVGMATNDHWTVTFTDTAGTGTAFNGNGSKVTLQNGTNVLGTYTLNQLKSTGLRVGFKCDNDRFAGIANLKISGTLASAPTLPVLFHDNFNVVSGNSQNVMTQDLNVRQSGPLAPTAYTHGDYHHQVGNTGTGVGQPFGAANSGYVLTAFNGNFYSDLDIPAIATGPLKIELDMYVNNNDWLALGLRQVPSDFFPIVGSGEFGFLKQSDGGLQLFQNGGGITPSGWNNSGFAPDNHMAFIFTDTAGTGSAFNGHGSKVTVLNGGTTLGTITLSQLSSSGLKLGFKADGNELGGIDNLTISGTAPSVIAPILVSDLNPLRSEVVTGTPLSLSVTANGTPLNYQWYNQSGPISGATNASYSFNSVAGTTYYHVAIMNTAGSLMSSTGVVISAANIVTVNNFSFENGSTVAFGNGSIPVQWTSFNGDWAGVSSGASQFSPAIVPDGTQYYAVNTGPGHSGPSGIYQDVGALQPNTTYTLTVAIGRGDNNGVVGGNGSWSPGIISLLNGTDDSGTVLATTTGYPTTPGTWQDYTATFTTGSSVSGDLVIELGVPPAATYQSLFDNVRLTTGAATATLTQTILPAHTETFVGDQVVFTAAYSNDVPSSVQWVQITSGATNLISTGVVNGSSGGVTTSTLTLNNVQLASAGNYVLEAINSTNSGAMAYSPVATLAVGTPATVGNVIQKNSGQTGPAGYYPAWSIATNTDLIFGYATDGSGNPGTATAGAGNYGVETGINGDPTILADGNLSNDKFGMVSCGPLSGAGLSMTYTLNTSSATNGYDLTNIVVYGGWPDDGRNEQKYQVLYSTIAAPTTFSSIGTFDYNPSFASSDPNATRVILTPATGALAQNVAAIQINWNLQGSPPKNGWEGYSEITVAGTRSAPVAVLTQDITPLKAEDVVGSSVTLQAGFSGATSYQWQKNGTNISGATGSTLTLNNLQLTDTATNGGYRLKAINGAGISVTRGCTLVVHPTPAAIGNTVVAYANQASDAATFSPTWDTSTFGASLISGTTPGDSGPGNFNDPDVNPVSANLAGGLPVLTDGDYGTVVDGGPHLAFATCGPAAGQYVTYTLPANANGYDLTNILVASGWNDDGRNADWATITYSTVANPTIFLPLAVVTNSPTLGTKSEIRATVTPAAGVLASNVYAVMFSFEWPQGIPNGYSGISQLNVLGTPSASAPPAGPVISLQHEEYNNTWAVETPNLIANQLPSSYGAGSFANEGCNVTNLTDGQLGFGYQYGTSCGGDGSAVPWVIFGTPNGWNLTNIVVYSLWHDYGRDGQFYNVSYSTRAHPATFIPLASVAYNPFVTHDGRASGNRVEISPALGADVLATNVAAVKFDFTPQGGQDYGWTGYSEIVLQGTNLPAVTVTPPVLGTATVAGGNLTLTGTGGTPWAAYTWLSTTNLANPVWVTNKTGTLDGTGAFTNSTPVGAVPASFFRLRLP